MCMIMYIMYVYYVCVCVYVYLHMIHTCISGALVCHPCWQLENERLWCDTSVRSKENVKFRAWQSGDLKKLNVVYKLG